MQAQFYHMENLKIYSKSVLNSSNNLSQDQIKETMFKIIQSLQEITYAIKQPKSMMIGKTPKQDGTNPNQILLLIQMKIFQMEQRRKVWDQTMAGIFNENDQIRRNFDKKLNEMQLLEKQFKKLECDMLQKMTQLNKDRQDKREILENKIDKMNESLRNELQIQKERNRGIEKQLKQIRNNLKETQRDQQQNKRRKLNFVVSCSYININSEKSLEHAKKMDKLENISEIQVQKYCKKNEINVQLIASKKSEQLEGENICQNSQKCKNIQVIIQNFRSLETLKNYINENEEVIQRLQSKILVLGQKLEVVSNKISDLLFQNVDKNISLNNSFKQSTYMSNNANSRNLIIEKSLQRNYQLQNPSDVKNFLQLRNQNIHNFKLQKDLIIYTNQIQKQSFPIFGCKSIRNLNTFTVQIIKTKNRQIYLGIANQKYYNSPNVWNQTNLLVMRGVKGQIYSGSKEITHNKKIGFKSGDKITIKTNFNNSKIQWYANDYLLHSLTSGMLKDNSIIWVPVLFFLNNEDCVRWISQQATPDFI